MTNDMAEQLIDELFGDDKKSELFKDMVDKDKINELLMEIDILRNRYKHDIMMVRNKYDHDIVSRLDKLTELLKCK